MTKLKELEKRLKDEPENLGLRVMVAGAMREAGRQEEAVELYRSVAVAYRDQGRSQQAIAVCRSILEIAPDDVRCHALLASLVAGHKGRAARDTANVYGDEIVLEVKTPPPPPGNSDKRERSPSVPPIAGRPATVPPAVGRTPTAPPGRTPTAPPVGRTPTAPQVGRTPTAPQLGRTPTAPQLGRTPTAPQLGRTPTAPPVGRTPTAPQVSRAPTPPQPGGLPPAKSTAPTIQPGRTPTPPKIATPIGTKVPMPAGRGTPSRSSARLDETPLPVPMPYHVADPTTKSLKKLSEVDLLVPTPDPDDMPVSEDAQTRPGDEERQSNEEKSGRVQGIANAARRISSALIATPSGGIPTVPDDLSAELDTRQRPRIESDDLEKIAKPPPTVPVERLEIIGAGDDDETAPPSITRNMRANTGDDDTEQEEEEGVPTLSDEEQDEPTRPRDTNLDLLIRTENEGPTGSAFFQPLPFDKREAVLARFHKKSVKKGTTVIRQGEVGHSLVVVVKGTLDARVDRKGGSIDLGAVGTGEFVGEGSLLARTPSPVQVVAASDCELLLLTPRDFYEIAGAFPALWAELKDAAERRKRELELHLRKS